MQKSAQITEIENPCLENKSLDAGAGNSLRIARTGLYFVPDVFKAYAYTGVPFGSYNCMDAPVLGHP